jgi:hypothetical protein
MTQSLCTLAHSQASEPETAFMIPGVLIVLARSCHIWLGMTISAEKDASKGCSGH